MYKGHRSTATHPGTKKRALIGVFHATRKFRALDTRVQPNQRIENRYSTTQENVAAFQPLRNRPHLRRAHKNSVSLLHARPPTYILLCALVVNAVSVSLPRRPRLFSLIALSTLFRPILHIKKMVGDGRMLLTLSSNDDTQEITYPRSLCPLSVCIDIAPDIYQISEDVTFQNPATYLHKLYTVLHWRIRNFISYSHERDEHWLRTKICRFREPRVAFSHHVLYASKSVT